MSGALALGREAVTRHAWEDAHARLAAADAEDGLEPADVERAALSAYLTGREEQADALWARAHTAWMSDGELPRAARCAFWLALPLLLRGETARGGGWLARAARALEPWPRECPEQGLLLLPAGLRAMGAGDAAGAAGVFTRAEEIGARFRDPDVLAFAYLGHGQALIRQGRISDGVSLLDEAMVAVTAEDVSPITTGLVYCAVLLACRDTFDLARAQEWTAVLGRWCDQHQGLVPFRGECLVHRSETLQMRGEWPAALSQAQEACAWLRGRSAEGRAHYQLGELHRLRGEDRRADEEYRTASALGQPPLPGCALLRLHQSHVDAAAAMIERALHAAPTGARRVALLPARVEIALARRDLPSARQAADELGSLCDEHGAPVLEAVGLQARGSVLVAEGSAAAALAPLERSRTLWSALPAPYEVARTRVDTALACRGLGDEDGAGMELDAARDAFARLGAAPDLMRADRLAGEAPAAGEGLTARELEVLSLVAEGRSNRDIAAALVISPHTVRRHLQNVFAKLGVASRSAATAHAIQHGLVRAVQVARKDQ